MLSERERLHNYCDDFIANKRAGGRSYARQEIHLRKYLEFCKDYDINNDLLSKEAVTAWCAVRGNESAKTRSGRAIPVRELAKYLNKRGISAYVAPKIKKSYDSGFAPYIFTNRELAALFTAADERRENVVRPNNHYTLPMMMRMIYACGLRRSEVVKLRICDVDLDECIVTVRNTKFGKDRLIPLHPAFQQALREYTNKELNGITDFNKPFFSTSTGNFYKSSSVYSAFRKFLDDAGISHGGKDKGPRLHDLRHTFAVNCLNNWVKDGNDITAAVPYLAAYLGHSHFRHSQVYLRLTADMFPDIVSKIERKFDVFPIWEGNYETN
jgi:integrase